VPVVDKSKCPSIQFTTYCPCTCTHAIQVKKVKICRWRAGKLAEAPLATELSSNVGVAAMILEVAFLCLYYVSLHMGAFPNITMSQLLYYIPTIIHFSAQQSK
jgi:hypothetical protein